MEAQHPHERHYYLQLLEVGPESRGRNVGPALLRVVLARVDRKRAPAYLEAPSERSAGLHERHRFVAREAIRLPDGPPLYPMCRQPV